MEVAQKNPYHVLFLGMHNSARSILAEAYLDWADSKRFIAHSAGVSPSGEVDPMVLELLIQHRIQPRVLRSKSWDEFMGPNAPMMDFVFILCEQASRAPAKEWPGDPAVAVWPVSDPSIIDSGADARRVAVLRTFAEVTSRINEFLDLPIADLGSRELQEALREIGGRRR